MSKICDPITEIMALEGIRLIGGNLVKIYEEKKKGLTDMAAWSAVCLASTYGGMAINQAGVTAPHGLEHPASGMRNITHGRGLAALTPVIYRRTIEAAPEAFAVISECLGGRDEKDCVDVIEALLCRLDLRTTLAAEGVLPEDVEWMTKNAFKVSAAGLQNHPRVFTEEEVARIYREAL